MKLIALLATVFVAALCASSVAQTFQIPVAGPHFVYAMNPQVQEHLKLSADQKKSIKKLLENIIQDDGAGHTMIVMGDQDDSKELDKKVLEIFNEKQKKRFVEIYLQQVGYSALSRKEYAEKLGVSKEQTSKLETIWESHSARMQELFDPSGSGEITIDKAQMDKLKERLNKEVEAVLTKKQLDDWKKMLGEKFELKDGHLLAA